MLRIRPEQVTTLTLSLTQRANRHLVLYARTRFPRELAHTDETALYELVTKVRVAAQQYGIHKENDVATFLDLTVMYGPDFPHASWATDILREEKTLGPYKMAVLRQRVRKSGVNF
jgi:hypothetical protein